MLGLAKVLMTQAVIYGNIIVNNVVRIKSSVNSLHSIQIIVDVDRSLHKNSF